MQAQRRPDARLWQVLLLAGLLQTLPLRRARAEDHLDYKFMYYQESDDRMRILSPTILYERDLSPTLNLKIEGIYNDISGATPTGAPLVPRAVISIAPLEAVHSFRILSGATGVVTPPPPPPPRPPPSSGGGTVTPGTPGSSGSSGTTVRQTTTTRSLGPFSSSGDLVLPTAQVEDTRLALNVELAKRIDRHLVTGQASYSTEDDYDSVAAALKDDVELNEKNTTLSSGLAYTHDTIDNFTTGGTENKDVVDAIAGITQLLGPTAYISCDLTLGYTSGYLADPYKVVELNGILVPEVRPGDKTKEIVRTSIAKYLDSLRASLEVSHRFYNDSFGITGNTFQLAWYQHLGQTWILRPLVRYYEQSQADFYGFRFTGAPEEYSSDYRVSELEATSLGLKLIWMPGDRYSFDAGYERYEQQGKDGVTPDAAYPSADIISIGGRLWF